MKIEVATEGHPLKRSAWTFDFNGSAFRLTEYTEQTRTTKRHKWRGPKWHSYGQSSLDKPTEIPEWVLGMAVKKLAYHASRSAVFIGHYNMDCIYRRPK